jgi:hypothetical protein
MFLVRTLAWFKKVGVAPLEHSGRVEVACVGVFSCASLLWSGAWGCVIVGVILGSVARVACGSVSASAANGSCVVSIGRVDEAYDALDACGARILRQ